VKIVLNTALAEGQRTLPYATIQLVEGFSLMLKYYIKTTEAVKHLRADIKGVVSFEYVIVAACVVVAVLFAFGPTGSGVIGSALSKGIAAIVSKIPTS
jgi:pilus assembly protein Flp/PilA